MVATREKASAAVKSHTTARPATPPPSEPSSLVEGDEPVETDYGIWLPSSSSPIESSFSEQTGSPSSLQSSALTLKPDEEAATDPANERRRAYATRAGYDEKDITRFWSHVNKDGPLPENRPELGPCWLWTGGKAGKGYAHFSLGRQRQVYGHRFAFEVENGHEPEGHLDHLCRRHACVRPSHLEDVTPRENVLRGEGFAAVNAIKETCVNGHPFDEENTYWRPDGLGRDCKKCRAEVQRRLRRERSLGQGYDEVCYLLHYDRALGSGSRGQAQHYIGKTKNMDQRMRQHRTGVGDQARLPLAFLKAGIGFRVAQVFHLEPGQRGFELERKLKNIKKARSICPVCQGKEVIDG